MRHVAGRSLRKQTNVLDTPEIGQLGGGVTVVGEGDSGGGISGGGKEDLSMMLLMYFCSRTSASHTHTHTHTHPESHRRNESR